MNPATPEEMITFRYSPYTREALAHIYDQLHHIHDGRNQNKLDPNVKKARILLDALRQTRFCQDEDRPYQVTLPKATAEQVIPLLLDAALQYKHMHPNTAIRTATAAFLGGRKNEGRLKFDHYVIDIEELINDLAPVAKQHGFAHLLYAPDVSKTTLLDWRNTYKKNFGQSIDPYMEQLNAIVGEGIRPQYGKGAPINEAPSIIDSNQAEQEGLLQASLKKGRKFE